MRIQKLHKEFIRSLHKLRTQQEILELLDCITMNLVQDVLLDLATEGFQDVLIVDHQYIYIADLTETVYFDRLFELIQDTTLFPFSRKSLESVEVGLDAVLVNLLGI